MISLSKPVKLSVVAGFRTSFPLHKFRAPINAPMYVDNESRDACSGKVLDRSGKDLDNCDARNMLRCYRGVRATLVIIITNCEVQSAHDFARVLPMEDNTYARARSTG